MGLEFLFTSSAILIFMALIAAAVIGSTQMFHKGFALLGWRRTLQGFLGVLLVVIVWEIVASGLQFNQLPNKILLQSYFAFTWVALFIYPLVLWFLSRGKPVLWAVMITVCVCLGVMFLIATSRVVPSGISFFGEKSIQSELILVSWSLLIAYCFCFSARIR
jgi:hypothetical protein